MQYFECYLCENGYIFRKKLWNILITYPNSTDSAAMVMEFNDVNCEIPENKDKEDLKEEFNILNGEYRLDSPVPWRKLRQPQQCIREFLESIKSGSVLRSRSSTRRMSIPLEPNIHEGIPHKNVALSSLPPLHKEKLRKLSLQLSADSLKIENCRSVPSQDVKRQLSPIMRKKDSYVELPSRGYNYAEELEFQPHYTGIGDANSSCESNYPDDELEENTGDESEGSESISDTHLMPRGSYSDEEDCGYPGDRIHGPGKRSTPLLIPGSRNSHVSLLSRSEPPLKLNVQNAVTEQAFIKSLDGSPLAFGDCGHPVLPDISPRAVHPLNEPDEVMGEGKSVTHCLKPVKRLIQEETMFRADCQSPRVVALKAQRSLFSSPVASPPSAKRKVHHLPPLKKEK